MRKFLRIIFVSILIFCSSCYNPFKKYAIDFRNVVWKSTNSSSINVSMYVIEECGKYHPSLVVLKTKNKNVYLCGNADDSFSFSEVDDYGFVKGSVNSSRNYLNSDLIYSSFIENITSDFNEELGFERNAYIELEMVKFEPHKDATPIMFSNVKYFSDSYNLLVYSKVRGQENVAASDTFFVSYGSMDINEEKVNIALKFLDESRFFIFRNDDIEDVIISGTYTNEWTDIVLNFETNLIDDLTSLSLKAEFLV